MKCSVVPYSHRPSKDSPHEPGRIVDGRFRHLLSFLYVVHRGRLPGHPTPADAEPLHELELIIKSLMWVAGPLGWCGRWAPLLHLAASPLAATCV